MTATYHKYLLNFKQAAGTSRGVITTKETWFIVIKKNGKTGVGECGILRGLSIDDRPDYQQKLAWTCQNINLGKDVLWYELLEFPSIQFGVEMAFLSLDSSNGFDLFPSEFTNNNNPILINGLVWMGDREYMKSQIIQKIKEGFSCIKLKIGAIDFQQELDLLKYIRQNFSENEIEIRVDANGAFAINDALQKLIKLSEFKLHSIEQPIAKNNLDQMTFLCKNSPIPIALDEELIGVFDKKQKEYILQNIKPQYIILKPSFIGGIKGSTEWIAIANKLKIGWWATSALESNIGLNAIAQWAFTQNNILPQGLGTGSLYTNNFNSPLVVKHGKIWYNKDLKWQKIDL